MFAETVGLDDSFDFFCWEESRPWRGLGRAPMPGRRGRAGMWRARRWASPYSSNEVGRASTHWASPYSLGEPVLGELGEPSNEVGASHQTRLGEPVLRGRWASHSTFTAASTPASKLRLLGTSSACSARLVPARHRGACSARLVKCQLGTVPARHCACSARLIKCSLGTVPARHI